RWRPRSASSVCSPAPQTAGTAYPQETLRWIGIERSDQFRAENRNWTSRPPSHRDAESEITGHEVVRVAIGKIGHGPLVTSCRRDASVRVKVIPSVLPVNRAKASAGLRALTKCFQQCERELTFQVGLLAVTSQPFSAPRSGWFGDDEVPGRFEICNPCRL